MNVVRLVLSLAALTAGLACNKAPPCPAKFDQSTPAECACNGAGSGTVWGTGIYTTDSPICTAAIHAGAIPAAGGVVKPRGAAGCAAYVGASQNGVTTSKWAAYQSSFFFEGHGDGKCPSVPAAAAPPAPAGVAQGGACPSTMAAFADHATAQEFTCTCPAGATGSVYGTGMYTTDSNICAAATHAGAAGAGGGSVKFKKAPGCPKYNGTAANGITTSSWGAYGSSYYFDGKGDGKCPG